MAIVYGDLIYLPTHGSLAEWEEANPILLEGQEGIATDGDSVHYKKVGDGVSPWNDLPWKTGPKGEDYVLTVEDKAEISGFAMKEITKHNDSDGTHQDIRAMVNEAKDIAKGKANSITFETEEQLKAWVNGEYQRSDGKTTADLNVGDNLYIIELGVPDYWWDGENIQPLGAEKPALSEYVKKEELEAQLSGVVIKEISAEDYATAVENGTVEAGTIYFVYD